CSPWRPVCAPGLARGDHAADTVIAFGVRWTAFVAALCLGFSLPLRLAPAAIVVILSCHCGEHIEQHAIDGFEHAGELVSVRGGHHPRRPQIEGDDADMLRGQLDL